MGPRVVTVRGMPNRRRRLDARTLHPRDYLRDPHQFGSHPHPTWRLPPGGDPRSLQVAAIEHQVARLVRERGSRDTAAQVCARFGFSRSFWGDCLAGRAWMGETVLAAALSALSPPSGSVR
ncbi:hypothetical protein GCM10009657_09950 [Oryzihumus leptocrescens]